MQKFVLTTLFLGLLVYLFYLPVPMEKIQASLDQETLLHLQKTEKAESSNSVVPIAESPIYPSTTVNSENNFKKNEKKSKVISGLRQTP